MRTTGWALLLSLLVPPVACGGSVTEPPADGGTGGGCGGKAGLACPSGMWCNFADGACKSPDALGTCRKREALPCVAPMPGDEVCGCDGNTYQSACTAYSSGQSVARAGSCEPAPARTCGGFVGATCGATEYCDWGTPPTTCGGDDSSGVCKSRPSSCVPADGIFCGCDGNRYESACAAAKAGVGLRSAGPC